MELQEIKFLRKKLGWNQTELAKRAGVSQSLIAKVETGTLDPSYRNARKILDALHEASAEKEEKASTIMNPKLISIKSKDSIKQAIAKMKHYEISQLPVIEKQKVIGLVSESTLLNAIDTKRVLVREIMEEAPPVVSKETPVSGIVHLLKFAPVVVVAEKGKLLGVITKADIVRKFV